MQHKDIFSHDERQNYSFFKVIDENEIKTGFNPKIETKKDYSSKYICLKCNKEFSNPAEWWDCCNDKK